MTFPFRLAVLGAMATFIATGQCAPADLARATALYDAGRFSTAREVFLEIERAGGPSGETDFYLGRLALWFDDGPAALRHLERADRLAPKTARIQNALGDAHGLAAQNANLLAKLGCARRALAAYREAVALEPRNPAWRWSLAGYYLVAPRLAGGGIDKARAEAEEIRRLDPTQGRIASATVCLAEGNPDPAFAEFDAVLRHAPDDFLALYHIGRCAAISGQQLARGLAALRRCLHLVPPAGDGMPTRAAVYHRLGMVLEKMERPAEAATEYARARTADPDFRPTKMALKI